MSGIVGFKTDLEWSYDGDKPPVPVWKDQIAVHLRWVAGARPYEAYGQKFTSITLACSNTWVCIDVAYTDFMHIWTRHLEGHL